MQDGPLSSVSWKSLHWYSPPYKKSQRPWTESTGGVGGGQEMRQVEEGRLSKGWRAVHTPGRPVLEGVLSLVPGQTGPHRMSAPSCAARLWTPDPLGSPPPGSTEHCCVPAHAGVPMFKPHLVCQIVP